MGAVLMELQRLGGSGQEERHVADRVGIVPDPLDDVLGTTDNLRAPRVVVARSKYGLFDELMRALLLGTNEHVDLRLPASDGRPARGLAREDSAKLIDRERLNGIVRVDDHGDAVASDDVLDELGVGLLRVLELRWRCLT